MIIFADVNECLVPNTCGDSGNCTNTFGDFYCDCPPGLSGKRCQVSLDSAFFFVIIILYDDRCLTCLKKTDENYIEETKKQLKTFSVTFHGLLTSSY